MRMSLPKYEHQKWLAGDIAVRVVDGRQSTTLRAISTQAL